MLRLILTASSAKATRVRQRLLELVRELKEDCEEPPAKGSSRSRRRARSESPAAEGERWALTLAFAPSWPRREGGTS